MVGSGQISENFLGLFLFIISILLLSSSSSSQAASNEFHVGGKDGWVVKPSEDYNHWAQRHRFQVNDSLHFKYKKGSDLVLVVKKEDYDSCNVNSPMQKMDDGDSTFQLNNSGLYFFISGNVDNCKNGQKMIVLVMAVRQKLPETPLVAAPPSEIDIPPQQVDLSSLIPSAESPLTASGSMRVGVGVGVIWIFITSFAGLV